MTSMLIHRGRRLARKAIAGLGSGLSTGPQLPRILMYHRVQPTPSRLAVSPDDFERHLDWLASEGLAVLTVSELVERAARQPDLRAVALSFDDGYREMATIVAPMLRRRRMRATFYVVTSCLGGDFMDPDQIRRLAAEGFEIGAHTHTHPTLTKVSHKTALHEIRTSRETLTDILGQPPKSFAYPRGRFTLDHVCIVDSLRFHNAVSVRPGIVGNQPAYLALPRTEVAGGDDVQLLSLKLSGGLDQAHQAWQALCGLAPSELLP